MSSASIPRIHVAKSEMQEILVKVCYLKSSEHGGHKIMRFIHKQSISVGHMLVYI